MHGPNAEDWQEHIDAGRSYLKTASNGTNRSAVFSNELIFQLTAMAIERLLVGVYQFHQKIPADHTLGGLVDDLAHICPLDESLADDIKAIGRFDNMCPLTPVDRTEPSDAEIRFMLDVGHRVQDFSEAQVRPATGRQESREGRSHSAPIDPGSQTPLP